MRSEADDSKAYLISSQVLRNASDACNTLVDEMCPNSRNLSPNRPTGWIMSIDPLSLSVVLCVLHAQNDRLPRNLTLDEMEQLLEICFEWDIVSKVSYFAATWINAFDVAHYSTLYELMQYTRLSKSFRLGAAFRMATKMIGRKWPRCPFDLLEGKGCGLDTKSLNAIQYQQSTAKEAIYKAMMEFSSNSHYGNWSPSKFTKPMLSALLQFEQSNLECAAVILIQHMKTFDFSFAPLYDYSISAGNQQVNVQVNALANAQVNQMEQERQTVINSINSALERCRGLCLHCTISGERMAPFCERKRDELSIAI